MNGRQDTNDTGTNAAPARLCLDQLNKGHATAVVGREDYCKPVGARVLRLKRTGL